MKTHDTILIYTHIYIYIYIYIYISAGPCLSGATRLRRVCCHLPVPILFYHLNHELTVEFSMHFRSFQVLKSAISCLPVCYLFLAVCYLLLTGLLYPTDRTVTLTLVCYLNPGSPRKPFKSHQISSLPPGHPKILKSESRTTIRHQNLS